jgi:hypothetical protein
MTTAAAKPFEPAFADFLAMAQAASDADYLRFCGKEDQYLHTHRPRLMAERGRRFVRIVSESPGNRFAWAFVDCTTGDVLKTASWKAPAKHARGNIFDDRNGCGRVQWTGVR